jgi:hypothetical protein
MGALDDPMGNLAEQIASVFGPTVTISRTTRTYDPAAGTDSETVSAYSVKVAPPESYSSGLMGREGSLVQAGDVKLLVPSRSLPSGFGAPSAESDTVTLGGVEYAVVAVSSVWSGEQVAAYELQLRA